MPTTRELKARILVLEDALSELIDEFTAFKHDTGFSYAPGLIRTEYLDDIRDVLNAKLPSSK